MIPSIEEIIAGMETGAYSREQGIAWLHQHADCHWPDETRAYVAAMVLQGFAAHDGYSVRVGVIGFHVPKPEAE